MWCSMEFYKCGALCKKYLYSKIQFNFDSVLQLEELRNDIVDLKEMYREQVDLLVSQV